MRSRPGGTPALPRARRLVGPRQPRRAVACEPFQRVRLRRVEHDPPLFEEDDAVASVEHAVGTLLGDDHRGTGGAGELDRLLGAFRVELGGRLVEQEQARLQGEHRGEADALELAAGQLGDRSLGQVSGADGGQRPLRARRDQLRHGAEVLEPERDFGLDPREHDLVLRVLEERRHAAGEVGRPGTPCVVAVDLDAACEAAPVEVRHEAGKRAQQGRLPAAGGAEERDHLARLELERNAVQRRGGGLRVAKREPLDPP
jgi:hypothetical protein